MQSGLDNWIVHLAAPCIHHYAKWTGSISSNLLVSLWGCLHGFECVLNLIRRACCCATSHTYEKVAWSCSMISHSYLSPVSWQVFMSVSSLVHFFLQQMSYIILYPLNVMYHICMISESYGFIIIIEYALWIMNYFLVQFSFSYKLNKQRELNITLCGITFMIWSTDKYGRVPLALSLISAYLEYLYACCLETRHCWEMYVHLLVGFVNTSSVGRESHKI